MQQPHWLCWAALLVATATCAAQQGPRTSTTPSQTSQADLLSDSEIFYAESGGIAGRVHEAHFKADGARVTVNYRAPDLHFPNGAQAGTVDRDAYLALWRDVDRLDIWTLESQRPSKGADLVQSELRIRRGTRTHTIRWDEGAAASGRLRDATAWATRVLAVAREYAAYR